MMRVIDDIRLRISLPVGAIVEPLYTYADRIDEQSGVVYLSFNSGRSIAIHYDASQWSCRIVDASPELSRSRDYPVHRIEWRNIQKTTAIKFELKYCGEGQADGNETYG